MEELDLKELISMFLKKKVLIIVVVLLFAIAGIIYTEKLIVPEYESSASLVLVQIGGDNSSQTNSITTTDVALNSKLVDDYREIARSKIVASKVIENLNINETVADIQKSISVSAISETELIQITVIDKDPELAYRITKEVTKVFIEKVNEIYNVSNIHILDDAEIPTEPSNVHLLKNVVIFTFVGAILVSTYIILVNMLDTTVKTDTDIEKATALPVLASIAFTDENTKKKIKYGTHNIISDDFNDWNEEANDEQVLYKHNSIVKKNAESEYVQDGEEKIKNNSIDKKKRNRRRGGKR